MVLFAIGRERPIAYLLAIVGNDRKKDDIAASLPASPSSYADASEDKRLRRDKPLLAKTD